MSSVNWSIKSVEEMAMLAPPPGAPASNYPLPGDTVWIEPGTYTRPYHPVTSGGDNYAEYGFPVTLMGEPGRPITIRGRAGHVTIDGGLAIIPPATDLVFQDMEITVLAPRPAGIFDADPTKLPFAWGGVNAFSGANLVFQNLRVHGNAQGMSLWESTTNTLVESCVIYGNGWPTNPDGYGHGHELYVQNIGPAPKTIHNCVIGKGFSGYSLHCYGEGGHANNIIVDNCVFESAANALIGGNLPSQGIVVKNCDFYHTTLMLGWCAHYNLDCALQYCNFLQDHNEVDIKNFVSMTLNNNTIYGWGANIVRDTNYAPPEGSTWQLNGSGNYIGGLDYMGFPSGYAPPAAFSSGRYQEVRPGYIQAGNVGTLQAGVARTRVLSDGSILLTSMGFNQPVSGLADALRGVLNADDIFTIVDPLTSVVIQGPTVVPAPPTPIPISGVIADPFWFAGIVRKVTPGSDPIQMQIDALSARVSALEAFVASIPRPTASEAPAPVATK